jgi:hypothetical protein
MGHNIFQFNFLYHTEITIIKFKSWQIETYGLDKERIEIPNKKGHAIHAWPFIKSMRLGD